LQKIRQDAGVDAGVSDGKMKEAVHASAFSFQKLPVCRRSLDASDGEDGTGIVGDEWDWSKLGGGYWASGNDLLKWAGSASH
jgi:hypothetical protein